MVQQYIREFKKAHINDQRTNPKEMVLNSIKQGI